MSNNKTLALERVISSMRLRVPQQEAMERFHEVGIHSADVAMIGDRMDTDIIAAMESGLDPILVLSGVSSRETVTRFPFRPRLILNGVGDIAQ